MNSLDKNERELLALRFFENKTAAETAAALGIREGAAHKRAARALERLRRFFLKRGIHSTTATISGAISANSVQAAPSALANSVTAVAMKKGVATSGSTSTLIKGTLKLMAWTKLKTAVVAGAIAIAVVGAATATIQHSKATARPAAFRFAGYATPEAAIQSAVWAASTGDVEKFLAGFTPEERERFKSTIMATKTPAEIRRRSIALAKAMTEYTITLKERVSDDEVRMHISAPPSPEGLPSGSTIIIMKRIGGEWKRAGDID